MDKKVTLRKSGSHGNVIVSEQRVAKWQNYILLRWLD